MRAQGETAEAGVADAAAETATGAAGAAGLGGAAAPAPRRLADAVRVLAADAVERAASGHPGMPMGMADAAEVLWNRFLRHDPADPRWPDRDRVVVSNGHGSMLLYAMLHLTGYELPMEELKRFRQLGSRTPGHPEHGVTPGVETSTGPLGQGLANGVGMALAEKLLAAEFNRPGHEVVDHRTFVLLGDGCLMEGISHEAASLAGTLGLGKLVCLYDDNGISIDGAVDGWFRDDTPARFEAYGWHVVPGVDGHDPAAIARAVDEAIRAADRPSLVCLRTIIGHGSPGKAGSAEAHGAPLGEREVAATRARLGWAHPPFEIPEEIYAAFDARPRGAARSAAWRERFAAYARAMRVRTLASVMGEQDLPEADRQFLEFGARFEQQFVNQASSRTLEESMQTGWDVLRGLPHNELARLSDAQIRKHLEEPAHA